MMAVSK